MSEKGDKAEQLFKEGYNCSQAVIGAFADEIGMDFETAVRLASSFGGGMGRMREVCGTVSAMFMIAGLKMGYSDPKAPQEKKEHYARIMHLEMCIRDSSLYWFGLSNAAKQKEMESKKSPYTPDWEGCFADTFTVEPRIGIFIDKNELEMLRDRCV